MTSLNNLLLTVGGSFAASILIKATIVLTLGLAFAWLFRRARAATRHAMLAAVFVILAALPVAATLLPAYKILVEQKRTPRGLLMLQTMIRSELELRFESLRPLPSRPAAADPRTPLISAFDAALLLWSLGAAASLLPVAFGLWQIRRLRRSAQPWERGWAVTTHLAARIGLHRTIDVRLHPTLGGPITCGIIRSAIILPREAETWEDAALERALLHELEHIRRADWAVQCVTRIVCGVYWFHPLAWMARTRLALEAERACDDAVIAQWDATVYADQLVALAARLSSTARLPALSMASRADLATRVGAMLDSRQPRGRASRRALGVTFAVTAALAIAIAPVRIVAAPQPQNYAAASNLIVEDVTVTDANGNPVENLTAADFTLTDNGVAQTIAFCEFQKVEGDSKVKPYYVVGYYARNYTPDGSFHRLQVQLVKQTADRLNFRSGYYAGKIFTYAGSAHTFTPSNGEGVARTVGGGAIDGAPGGVVGGVPGGVVDGVPGGVRGGISSAGPDGRPGVFGRVGGGDGVFAESASPSSTQSRSAAPPVQPDASGITEPIPIFRPEPEYSEEARKAKYQGVAVVLVDIDATGRVTNAKMQRSLGLGLDEKAVEAALRWRFKAATKNGAPIAVQRRIEMSFRLL